MQETDNAMGEAIGAAYVARHFPPEAKARMVALVDNLLAEFDRGIDRLDWMSPATRKEAHDEAREDQRQDRATRTSGATTRASRSLPPTSSAT